MKNKTKKKLADMAKDSIRSPGYVFGVHSVMHLLEPYDEEVHGEICGNCANWHCDDTLHEIGHCTIYGHYDVFHERICNPPCTKFKRR